VHGASSHTTVAASSRDRDVIRTAIYAKYEEAAMVVILAIQEQQETNNEINNYS
jgi:hypothetical protein